MKTKTHAFLALGLMASLPQAAQAQQVSADILFGNGPVAGRVVIGNPYGYYYPAPVVVYPPRRVVVVERVPAPRVIVVYRPQRDYGYYRHHGYRAITVYYDPQRDCWYDGYDRNGRYRGYERNGYYRDGYRWRGYSAWERNGRIYLSDRDHDRDRHDGRWSRRHDDDDDQRWEDRD